MTSPQTPTPTANQPDSSKEGFKFNKRFLIIGAVILLVILSAFLIIGAQKKTAPNSPQPDQPTDKTWEIVLTYNNKLNVLSLKKLSLLNKTIRPDLRGQKDSPYELTVLAQKKTLYQTRIVISEQLIPNLLMDYKGSLPPPPEEVTTYVYIPYFPSADKIEITKNKQSVLKISLHPTQSFHIVPEVNAAVNPAGPTCGPMEVVFMNDNFTDISEFHDIVDSLIDTFNSVEPYSTANPSIFDFKTIDSNQSLGCNTDMVACLQSGQIAAKGLAVYPNAAKFITIANSPTSSPNNDGYGGFANGLGGDSAVFLNDPRISVSIQVLATHEFLGHAVGELYDRYVFSDQFIAQNPQRIPPLIPGLRSNCTDSSAGESFWTSAGSSGPRAACVRGSYFAPFPVQCPMSGNPIVSYGGRTDTVMSGAGCNNIPVFDSVERDWIQNHILPQYQSCQASNPQGSCNITDAYWQDSSAQACTQASLVVKTSGNCSGKSLNFQIIEDDGQIGPDNQGVDDALPTSEDPADEIISASGVTDADWTPVAQTADDLSDNVTLEYYASVNIEGETTTFSTTQSSNAGKLISVDPTTLTASCSSPSPSQAGSPRPSASPASGSPRRTQTYECTQDTTGAGGRQLQLGNLTCTLVPSPSDEPTGPINFSVPTIDWEDIIAVLNATHKMASLSPSCKNDLIRAAAEEGSDANGFINLAPGTRLYLCHQNQNCTTNGYSAYDGAEPLPTFVPAVSCQQELNNAFQGIDPNNPDPNVLPVVWQDVFNSRNQDCDASDLICVNP